MNELEFFYQLKKELLSKYQESYPEWKRSIHDFKGKEISNFQKLLEEKVNSRISEKWFYTHLKPTENEKLPRMDMLDLLCQFLDFSDWEAFKKAPQFRNHLETKKEELASETNQSFQYRKLSILITLLIAIILSGFYFITNEDAPLQFCFHDADMHELLTHDSIGIEIFKNGESPILQRLGGGECFKWDADQTTLTFAVHAPYYHSDTITRSSKNQKNQEIIYLKKDDYALMIHLFSTSNFKDWEKRRTQLGQMIAEDAIIFQVENGDTSAGVDMLNKEEFIDRLTLPINSLKNIKIIHTMYKDEKIFRLRFILNE